MAAARSSPPPVGPLVGLAPHPLPLNIGHRGYRSVFPENTVAAFAGAAAAGAHAVETDLRLSRDGVVVLCHDAALSRVFGLDARVADCDWALLRTLEARGPRRRRGAARDGAGVGRQRMACLADLLAWMGEPGNEAVWAVLDVKPVEEPAELLAAVARTLEEVRPVRGAREWRERLVVGGWSKTYLDLAAQYLPGFQRIYIGLSPLYAWELLSADYADVHFNILQPTLVGPIGARFRRAVRAAGRKLLVWTVNNEHWMEWAVRKRDTVDGVITDRVELYRDVRRRHRKDEDEEESDLEDVKAGDRRVSVDERRVGLARRFTLYLVAFILQVVAVPAAIIRHHQLRYKGKGSKEAVRRPLELGKTA